MELKGDKTQHKMKMEKAETNNKNLKKYKKEIKMKME